MAKNFSDKYITSLKPKVKSYQVREAKGFTIRVLPTGCKTFLFIYEVDGKRKQVNLGNYPYTTLAAARNKYNALAEAYNLGEPVVPPVEATSEEPPKQEETITVKYLVGKYLESGKENTKGWEGMKNSILTKKISSWHHREVTSVTKKDLVTLLEKDLENGEGAAACTCKVISAMFAYAVDMEIINNTPFLRMQRVMPVLKAKTRTRFLTEQEISATWKLIDTTKGLDVLKRVLKVVLLTAQRPGEVLGMHRGEINGDWWTIPAHRALKGNRDHRVFLTKTVKDLIGDGEEYIFPAAIQSTQGHVSAPALVQFARKVNDKKAEKWTPHDLRRTARTHMSRLRIPREHAEAVLNHAKGGMVKVYDQYVYDNEKREALQLWEAEVLNLVAQDIRSE